ncbi:MAG: hypothetical protein WCZ20_06865, partial [Hydrogenophaga sp.]
MTVANQPGIRNFKGVGLDMAGGNDQETKRPVRAVLPHRHPEAGPRSPLAGAAGAVAIGHAQLAEQEG